MNHPADEFVASFVGVETILTGSVIRREGGSISVLLFGSNQEIEAVGEARPGETLVLCIRPENVVLSTGLSRDVTSARNVFQGKITKVVPMGFYHRIELDCGFPLVAYVTDHSLEGLSLHPGKDVKASFKATAIHVVRRKG